MRKHDTFGMPCCSAGVHQESKILCWLRGLGSPIPRRSSCVEDTCKVLHSVRQILLVSHDNDLVECNPSLLSCLLRILDEGQLSDNSPGPRVLELERELFNRVVWVGWRYNTASPMTSPCYGRGIDAIWRVECKNVTSLPVPEGLESFAKLNSGIFDLNVGIRSLGVWV